MPVRDLVEDLGAPASGWLNALCLAAVAVGSAAPLTRWWWTGAEDQSVEKELRLAAEWPERPTQLADLDRFPAEFAEAFDDRFPFRRELLRLHNLFVWEVLGAIADPAMQRGKDGWLYLAGPKAMGHYRARNPFDPSELDLWVETYDGWRDWLAARDVEYVLMFTPDKQGTYPEYLPDWVVAESDRTRTDEFFEALRERSEIEVLDVRQQVREAKSEGLTFFQHGTHWNMRGSWHAYVAMAEQLVAKLEGQAALPREAFDVVDATLLDEGWYGDSWFERLHMADLVRQEAIQFAFLHQPTWFILETWEAPTGLLDGRSGNADQSLPKAVYVRDSTGDWLWPIFVHHFSELVLEGANRFPATLIEVERPDVVLHTRIERILSGEIELPSYSTEEVSVARQWNAAGDSRELLEQPAEASSEVGLPVSIPGSSSVPGWLRVVRTLPEGAETPEAWVRLLTPDPILIRFQAGRAFAFVERPTVGDSDALTGSSSPSDSASRPTRIESVTWRTKAQ